MRIDWGWVAVGGLWVLPGDTIFGLLMLWSVPSGLLGIVQAWGDYQWMQQHAGEPQWVFDGFGTPLYRRWLFWVIEALMLFTLTMVIEFFRDCLNPQRGKPLPDPNEFWNTRTRRWYMQHTLYESYDDEKRARLGLGRAYDPDYQPFLYNDDEEAIYPKWKADYDRRRAAGEVLNHDSWVIGGERVYRWQDGFLVSVLYALIFLAGFWYVTCIVPGG